MGKNKLYTETSKVRLDKQFSDVEHLVVFRSHDPFDQHRGQLIWANLKEKNSNWQVKTCSLHATFRPGSHAKPNWWIKCGKRAVSESIWCGRKRQTRHWSGRWFIRCSSQVPNLMHALCRIQNILVYGARNTSVCLVLSSRIMKLSRAGKRTVQSHVVIQMNPAKIEIYRSKKSGLLQRGNPPNSDLFLSPYMK